MEAKVMARPNLAHLRSELVMAATVDQFVVFGSTVMYLHGLRREIGDIDIFVKQPVWDVLEARGWRRRYPNPHDPPLLEWYCDGTTVHVWVEWDDRHLCGDIPGMCFGSVEYVDGWPCQSLALLLEWKAAVLRPKDVADAQILRRHLGVAA